MINNTTYKTFNNLPSMKKLSRAEIAFLTLLRNGLDSQFDYTTSWLISSNGNRFMNAVNHDNFDDEFNDSKIREILIDLIIQNSLNGTSLLKKFYLQGSRLGYYQLGQGSLFGKSDKRAVEILTNYVQEVINSINTEYAIGIRETLRKNIDTPSNIRSDLINLAYTPIQSKIPVDTRCQFTARTEYARAVNTGTLQAFANYGVQKVNIITAGDERVCNTCRYYEAHNPFDLEIAMKLLPMHPNCYMPDTQVFTDHGWKYFYELKSSDKILSLNPETMQTEFLDYVRVIEHDSHLGYLVHVYNNTDIDFCVTLDHDVFVSEDNNFKFVKAYKLIDSTYNCDLLVDHTDNYYVSLQDCDVELVPYTGFVHCVELPKYHTLWTKRNGKTSWNGNCRCSFGPVIYYDLSRIKDPIVVNLTRNHEGDGLTASI